MYFYILLDYGIKHYKREIRWVCFHTYRNPHTAGMSLQYERKSTVKN